ncbi:MAG: prolipoprotein diacylglyceryl transferase family protein [Desulfomonilaceae bacterium]
MNAECFIATIGVLAFLFLRWAFRTLPSEGWQILASVPYHKNDNDTWRGINLTYYGLFIGLSVAVANAAMLLLIGTIGGSLTCAILLEAGILFVCMPAARWMARIVEKKQHTFSIAGAAFVAILIAPLLIAFINEVVSSLELQGLSFMPTVASLSIAYTFGEGLGRVACISFGCCYGKPLEDVAPWLQKMCRSYHFVFAEKTRKVSYEGVLEGRKLFPIQALTSIVLIAVGLVSMLCFLKGFFTTAFLVSLCGAQGWRVVSETLRADWRGDGKISAYQMMAVASVAAAWGYLLLAPMDIVPQPELLKGFAFLWDPVCIILLPLAGLVAFYFTGRSAVTASHLTFYVVKERV